MPMYLLAYHGGGEPPEGEDAIAVVMDAWNAWMESIADQLVDSGNPVGATKVVNPDGTVGDAPDAPISGYSIVEADDMDAAIEMARTCPIIADGGSVEVAELVEMGGAEIDDDLDDDDDDDDEEEDDEEKKED